MTLTRPVGYLHIPYFWDQSWNCTIFFRSLWGYVRNRNSCTTFTSPINSAMYTVVSSVVEVKKYARPHFSKKFGAYVYRVVAIDDDLVIIMLVIPNIRLQKNIISIFKLYFWK